MDKSPESASCAITTKIWECLGRVDDLKAILKPVITETPLCMEKSTNVGSTPVLQILETLNSSLKELQDTVVI